MRTIALEGDLLRKVSAAVTQSQLFASLNADAVRELVSTAVLLQYEPQEAIVRRDEPSDSFFLLLKGNATVRVGGEGGKEATDLVTMKPPDVVGEMGLLLGQPRSASVIADTQVMAVKFESAAFDAMFQKFPAFGRAVAKALAARLASASRQMPLPEHEEAARPTKEVLELLPVDFMQRQRVVPLSVEGKVLTLGFVDDPTPQAIAGARQLLPSLELRAVRVSGKVLTDILSTHSGSAGSEPTGVTSETPPRAGSPRLDALLKRMVAEGASDLHLSAGHKPRWRLDGEIQELQDARVLGENEVLELLQPILPNRHQKAFADDNDVDFAYPLPGVARFRVNVFRDHRGVGTVMRQIPDKILSFEQLGLPAATQTLCNNPKGLVLVTGPTGSGKSTTLAAMVDYINRHRRTHILTLEDPIEFVHRSQLALVNQREVGEHTKSFSRALKAALREDPDIVLVGEMRDLETVSLALETANTGHLVFGTLHTSTAVSTIDRVIGLFPPEQQGQIRNSLAEVLRGVVAQTLCRKIGGGRVAALEILVSNHAVANLIREGKNHQIGSVLTTGKSFGCQLLNEELAKLVNDKRVDYEEALVKALDKADLAKRCGREPAKV